jgi:type I restriction enzyme, S subunit
LTREKLKEINVIVPPEKEQTKIAEYSHKETNKINLTTIKLQKEIDFLQEYRAALISEVVTGKIDVRQEVVS